MPEGFPGIEFDEKGVCNLCNRFEKLWGEWTRSEKLKAKSSKELLKIFDWAKGKNRKGNMMPLPLVVVEIVRTHCIFVRKCTG